MDESDSFHHRDIVIDVVGVRSYAMSKKWLRTALMVSALVGGAVIQVDAETVLYVPQDDRPVSLKYTVETAEDAGFTVLTHLKI